MSNQVYAIGGDRATAPGVLAFNNPPPANFRGALGQSYYDRSTTPFTQYIYNGTNWVLGASSNGFPITPFVVGPIGQAGYQTIQAGLNAAGAVGGGMVWVQKGTYTENLVFPPNIQLFGDSEQGTIIIGTHTPPTTGTLNINRVKFQSTGDIFFSTAAGSCIIFLEDSTVAVTSGWTFDLINWVGQIQCFNIGNFGVNDGFLNNTGGALFFVFAAGIGNGTTHTMTISGFTLFGPGITVNCPLNLVTGANLISTNNQYTGTVTFSNNSIASFYNDSFVTGAEPALVQSSTGAVSFNNVVINSTSNPAITGAGTGILTLNNIGWTNGDIISGTVTLAGTTLTPTINTALSTGTLSIKSTSANPGNNAGFLQVYINGTVAYLPYFTNIAP